MLARVRTLSLQAVIQAIVLALALAVLLPAHRALARIDSDDVHIDIDQVDIDATLDTDGSLWVSEVRTFRGSFNGVYWYVPQGSYEGVDVQTQITEVGELVDGTLQPFTESNSGQDGTYELTYYDDAVRVKVYSEHYETTARMVISYVSTNVARRYDDVSELYWQFVTQGWDVESENVTCTVHLPVPEGKQVEPEENVRAWGHGPLDASLDFVGNDVVYTVPGVGGSEFAEARITMPDDWLSEASSQGGRVLQDILAEEQAWADEANARRKRAQMLVYGGCGLDLLATLGAIVGSVFAFIRHRKVNKPQFDDRYFRDVPTNDHPAVLGALWRGGSPADEDFTATLMHLTDMGVITIEPIETKEKGLFGRSKSSKDYRLTCLPKASDMKLATIDRQALLSLFDSIGRLAKRHAGDDPEAEVVYFGDLEGVGKKHPNQFARAYDAWTAQVEAEVARRRFFKSDGFTGAPIGGFCAFLCVALGAATLYLLLITGAWKFCLALLLLQVVGLVISLAVAGSCGPMSREAIETKAKLDALQNWLTDFTNLEEAIPRDVVLWNRLLVMAVVLGVADKVIDQLKMKVPELLEDQRIMPMYYWYGGGMRGGRPYSSFSSSYSSAHNVSSAALAASKSSSGGGGGGGFSGGGGGGFGGGGGSHSGGGAF